jgi:hypothetical protein
MRAQQQLLLLLGVVVVARAPQLGVGAGWDERTASRKTAEALACSAAVSPARCEGAPKAAAAAMTAAVVVMPACKSSWRR